MVDVIIVAKAILQMHVIVDGRKYIILCNMLRNQIMDLAADRLLDILQIRVLFQNLLQNRIIHFFRHMNFLRVHIHPAGDVYHHI